MSGESTIAALSSGAVPSAVAVVRLSGPASGPVLAGLIGGPLPAPRRASLRRLRRPETGALIDRAVVLWLPGPETATGEDMVELHLHGGRAVVAAALDAVTAHPDVRLAEAGEFTRRAFLAGRMDLAEVEGLADLLAAETEAQRRQAVAQADGALSRRIAHWRAQALEARALIEAGLDFTDEDDVDERAEAGALAIAAALAGDLKRALDDGHRAERLREGFRVALMGPPNAGKSSLMNALARREVAIVTAEAGTTRDVIEVHLDLGGWPVLILDTAGIREAESLAEREGVRRAIAHGEVADLVLWLDPADGGAIEPPSALAARPGFRRVLSKTDLAPAGRRTRGHAFTVSAATGAGVGDLLEGLALAAAEGLAGGESGLVTRARHRAAIADAVAAIGLAHSAKGSELKAEHLRRAADALGAVIGAIGVEDVLGAIFSTFCIGK
ncbi:tRNA uridine-5-carboxymethylaminomethyl(34) synthesis GTPase MnmE [Segnochrobactrum spirostomi]|uniref:tRNA modification GTPase MnmE n=1 Tax=Segnochrobactrum spirostomi TaxID=2608987 RepID=A0A6A7Y2B9_9HYPH|nr:tRNA uridine-5-carboxymethylaminomethyl(34) synthesis GTPase MnmE [Segnochrobactrum spirostomi]MQT12876.1 tRNA uridine-5-carboxymethylaminomethyl(34) synthesis GTPase MnmE [Segnochrobactrum spirostomi]